MKHQEAVQQAIQLHQQGVKFSTITEHLAKAGYRSNRTGRPVTEMGVRYMVSSARRDSIIEAAEDSAVMRVTTASLTDIVKKLADLGGVEEEVKLELIQALIASRKRGA